MSRSLRLNLAFDGSSASDEETDDEMPPLESPEGALEQASTTTSQANFVFHSVFSNDEEVEEEDYIPQPEVTESNSSSSSPPAAASPTIRNILGEEIMRRGDHSSQKEAKIADGTSPSRRIVGAVRPTNDGSISTDNCGLRTAAPKNTAATALNGNAVALDVNWSLFPAPSDETTPNPLFNFQFGTATTGTRSDTGNGTATAASSPLLTTNGSNTANVPFRFGFATNNNSNSTTTTAAAANTSTTPNITSATSLNVPFRFGWSHNNNNSTSASTTVIATNNSIPNNDAVAEEKDDDEIHSYRSSDEEEKENDDDDNDDEVLSYHSSEEESDDSDEDDYDEGMDPHGMPPGMFNFFHRMTQMASDDDDDDDDDDDSNCRCDHCLMERFGRAALEEDENDKTEGTIIDPNASPCAICMEPETSHRVFAHLPCCGNDGKESTSSTRFCQKCLVRYLAQNGGSVPAPAVEEGWLAGECPRCKHLLVLQEIITDKSIPYYKRVQPIAAATDSLHWYIGHKDGGQYRPYLLTVAWCSSNYLAEELLLINPGSFKQIGDLCQWGLLQKHKAPVEKSALAERLHLILHQKFPEVVMHPYTTFRSLNTSLPNSAGWIYSVKPDVQMELRTLLLQHMEVDHEGDLQLRMSNKNSGTLPSEENYRQQCFFVAYNCAASAWMAFCRLQFGRAIRIGSRGFTLFLLSNMVLPCVADWPTDPKKHAMCWHTLTALNFVVALFALRILRKAAWIALYLAQAFVVCWLVGSCIVTPKCTWKRWTRDGCLVSSVVYGLYQMWCWYATGEAVEGATEGTFEILSDEL